MDSDGVLDPAEVFDQLGADYEAAFHEAPLVWEGLDALLARLRPDDEVLDLGSGTGRPVSERLSGAGCGVTGLDVSATMIELARRRVPEARFELTDIRERDFPPESFHAVVAFFSFLTLSRTEIRTMLERVRRWLAPEGMLALLTVPGDIEQRVVRFLGYPIRATSFAAEQWPDVLEEAGLEVLWSRSEPFVPTGRSRAETEQHLLLLARKT
ncbi:Methyltransferase domain-containing protein [Actinopolyspora xinjiangensis]|uniref:Methyltransferase domain-containing protein n=1 Tax=Actinopolyspora xinjiangensis TaxID=405564 RepID=A0A1H0W166_9ACTN|nr:class I SAM-dependent methyltransferase [Actinopolyspora xinjiangensis]SDP84490.1 Methyltransferase domain-containing protein [Actinopolyspora xinjiangensis]